MSTGISCPHCNTALRIEDLSAAQGDKCPRCRRAYVRPQWFDLAAPAALEADRLDATATAADVLNSIPNAIPRVTLPLRYRCAIALVALAMLAMVVLYAGAIVLLGTLICAYELHEVSRLSEATSAGGAVLHLLACAGPLAAGALLLTLLLKPLLARPVMRDVSRPLERDRESLLFAFVERICDAVGAPRPTQIQVDCQVNASAGFRRGMESMFGRDPVLTIGLPLVAGLDVRQLAAVLAHEMGHFSQTAGMRLSYVLRYADQWLCRAAYQTDPLDQWLDDAIQRRGRSSAVLLRAARSSVAGSRRLLSVLATMGHVVSRLLMRQMEFNADRYAARLVGPSAFAAMLRRLEALRAATHWAYADLHEFYREGRLGDDLPRLIQANLLQMPDALRQFAKARSGGAKSDYFDTHPSARERIEAVRREQSPPTPQVDASASSLLSDFVGLSKAVTSDFYRTLFGSGFKITEVRPIGELLARQMLVHDSRKALVRYFQGTFSSQRPLHLMSVAPEPVTAEAASGVLAKCRRLLLCNWAAHQKAFHDYDGADSRLLEVAQIVTLLKAGFQLRTEQCGLSVTSHTAAKAARHAAEAELARAADTLTPIERCNSRRLLTALQLLDCEQVANRLPDAARWRQERDPLLAVARRIGDHFDELTRLRNTYGQLQILLENLPGNEGRGVLLARIYHKARRCSRRMRRVLVKLEKLPYPFDHPDGPMELSAYILGESPHGVWEICRACEQMLDHTWSLYVRVLAQLALIAECVESAVGLAPLAEPDSDAALAAQGCLSSTA